MKRAFETQWCAMIQLTYPDGRIGCGWWCGGRTLPEFFADAFRTGTFAVARSTDDETTYMLTSITCECVACAGWGTMAIGKRIRRTVACKACRGVGIVERMDDVPLVLHPNIRDDINIAKTSLRGAYARLATLDGKLTA